MNIHDLKAFQEFGELCNQKDTVSRDISGRIAENMMRFAQDTMLKAAQNVKDTAKAAKGKEDGDEDPEETRRNEIRAMFENEERFWPLNDNDQESVINAYDHYEKRLQSKLNQYGVKNASELPYEVLFALDSAWNKEVDSIDFDSPVKEMLNQMTISRKTAEKEQKRKDKEFKTKLAIDSYEASGKRNVVPDKTYAASQDVSNKDEYDKRWEEAQRESARLRKTEQAEKKIAPKKKDYVRRVNYFPRKQEK